MEIGRKMYERSQPPSLLYSHRLAILIAGSISAGSLAKQGSRCISVKLCFLAGELVDWFDCWEPKRREPKKEAQPKDCRDDERNVLCS